MRNAAKERLEWATAIGIDVAVLVTGITMVVVARTTDVPDWPWTYIGFFITAVGLVGELALGISLADRASHHPQQRDQRK